MKLLIRFLAISFFLTGMMSCDEDDDPAPTSTTTSFAAVINGASEVPPNASAASGSASLTFNNTSKVMTLTVPFTGVVATDAHIHKGAIGVSGPAVFPLSDLISPITFTSDPLTAAQEADLKANLYYVNIHSAAYPDGEIRGQLMKQTSGGGGGY